MYTDCVSHGAPTGRLVGVYIFSRILTEPYKDKLNSCKVLCISSYVLMKSCLSMNPFQGVISSDIFYRNQSCEPAMHLFACSNRSNQNCIKKIYIMTYVVNCIHILRATFIVNWSQPI